MSLIEQFLSVFGLAMVPVFELRGAIPVGVAAGLPFWAVFLTAFLGNLLREGLDLPEVALVAILDADKEGFLRSPTSLIQTIGRAARNADGRVIMYADRITPAMDYAITETQRRRELQQAYNEAHGIVPKTIIKSVRELIEISRTVDVEKDGKKLTKNEREAEIARLEKEMKQAAKMMEFEYAAVLRDQIIKLRGSEKGR